MSRQLLFTLKSAFQPVVELPVGLVRVTEVQLQQSAQMNHTVVLLAGEAEAVIVPLLVDQFPAKFQGLVTRREENTQGATVSEGQRETIRRAEPVVTELPVWRRN